MKAPCLDFGEARLASPYTLASLGEVVLVLSGSALTSPVLAQKPITLVLMMINSCSYSTNDLVFI